MTRPRRSALYVPGDKPRALDKARGLPADVLILDLEDAVAPEHKPAARANVLAALRAGFPGQEVAVRVNALHTPWGLSDYQALLLALPDAIVLPKAESPEAVRELTLGTDLWLTIETPLGVLRAPALAAVPGVAALIAGTSDLIHELRARHTPDRLPLLHALGMIVLAARAHGRTALDGVHLNLTDAAGLAASCRQGRELGFDGKTLIHPDQIAAANAAFGPSSEDVQVARDLLAAWEAARAQGKSVTTFQGRLIEQLHATEARELLALWQRVQDRA